jgi:hypothetical protein
LAFAAHLPEFREGIRVEDTHTGIVCMRIELVIEDNAGNLKTPFPFGSEQKRSRFVRLITATK